jgi:hypothetical protein
MDNQETAAFSLVQLKQSEVISVVSFVKKVHFLKQKPLNGIIF